MVNAGRILILAKGAWSATTNYTQLDLVSYNSIAYLARQASVGVNPAQDTQMNYWMPFGSAAGIATTSTPGLVMPDGTTITITNTGLIKAVLGVNDITDVVITSPTNGQVIKYNSTTQKWENGSLGTAANKDATNTISSGSTDLIESGAVHSAIQTLSNKVSNSDDAYSSSKAYKVGDLVIHDDVLYRCITACSAAAWSVNQSCFISDTLANAVSTINGVLNNKITVPLNTTDTWGQVGNKIANALSGFDLNNYLNATIMGGNNPYKYCYRLQSTESIGVIFSRTYTNPSSLITTIPTLCIKENGSSLITTRLAANEVSFMDYTNAAANLSSIDIHLQ